MKIKFNTSIAGETWSHHIGEVAEVKDEIALKWISSGIASPVHAPAETASVQAPETADLKRRK